MDSKTNEKAQLDLLGISGKGPTPAAKSGIKPAVSHGTDRHSVIRRQGSTPAAKNGTKPVRHGTDRHSVIRSQALTSDSHATDDAKTGPGQSEQKK